MGALYEAIEAARRAEDPYVEGVQSEGETIDVACDLGFFELHDLHLTRCSLAGAYLAKASLYDCTLVECDLSNADLTEVYLARTHLVDCKLTGAQMTKAFLKRTRLVNCSCRYANLGEATLEATTFTDCDLQESFLAEMRLRGKPRFEKCDLTRADLFRTPLKGMDFSTCVIAGIAVSDTRSELRGATISLEQAPDVAAMLGVRIL